MARDLDIGSVRIPAADLAVRAVRSSGPGGQNVNKVSSKIELRFDLPGTSALDAGTRSRLGLLALGRLDAEGWVVLTSQLTRDRQQNLEDAYAKLTDLVKRALVVPKKRRPTRPSRASRERRLEQKRHQSAKKTTRRVRADD